MAVAAAAAATAGEVAAKRLVLSIGAEVGAGVGGPEHRGSRGRGEEEQLGQILPEETRPGCGGRQNREPPG